MMNCPYDGFDLKLIVHDIILCERCGAEWRRAY
jgi:hypothetical protein